MYHTTCSRARAVRLVVTIFLAFVAVVASGAVPAEEGREFTLKTTIVNATIYGGKVQVTRRGEVEVSGGPCRLICEDLPEAFIESSLQVGGTGSATAKIVGIDLERREKACRHFAYLVYRTLGRRVVARARGWSRRLGGDARCA